MKITVNTLLLVGLNAVVTPVHIEATRDARDPLLAIEGLRESQTKETRVRVRAALQQSGVDLSGWTIHITAEPPPGASGQIDLAAAVGVLVCVGMVSETDIEKTFFVGELSLSGDVRPIRGASSVVTSAAANSPTGHMVPWVVVPWDNQAEATRAAALDGDRVKIAPIKKLADLFEGRPLAAAWERQNINHIHTGVDFAEVRGMGAARRALEIAAVGGHHVLLVSPPGSSATMIARRLITILPARSDREIAETTAIHSAAGLLRADLGYLPERPFRAPHHTVSSSGLIGGGHPHRPGEVTLAHHGVLFLDEIQEFRRSALEEVARAVRAGQVTHVGREEGREYRVTFPSAPIVVGQVAPCPCGQLGSETKRCLCAPERITTYWDRLRKSPIWDLFDIRVHLAPVNAATLATVEHGESSAVILERVSKALSAPPPLVVDSGIGSNDHPKRALRNIARSTSEAEMARTLHVARSVARLAGIPVVTEAHIAEAANLRNVASSSKEAAS